MNDTISERRLAENEVVFRNRNELMQSGLDEMKRIAKEDQQEHLLEEMDIPLRFYCECADENCRQRITMLASRYDEIHKKRDRFVVVCGHNIPSIEKIVEETPKYCVVKKYKTPPESAENLNQTDINNS